MITPDRGTRPGSAITNSDCFSGFASTFFLRHLDEGVLVERVALDDVLVGDLLAGVGVHLGVLDAVAGLPVELVEGDLLGFRGGGV